MGLKWLMAGLLLLPTAGFTDAPVTLSLPPQGFSAVQDAIPHGKVSGTIKYPTRKINERPVNIYTPPGYSATGTTKYPVLYLLHGIGGDELTWTGKSNPGKFVEGDAQNVMDYLYSKNLAKPMIIVMPYGNMENSGGDGWSNFEDVLLNDLIPFVEKNYAVSPDSNMRGLAGLSWGAGQALNFGFRNYKVFTHIGGFSPAPFRPDPKAAITNPADIDKVVNFCFVSSGTDEAAAGYGTRAASWHDNWHTNNIAPHMYTIEPGVGHVRANWNRNLYNFAQRIFTNAPTGITIRPLAENKRSQVGLSSVRPGQFIIDGWKENGIFNLNGRAVMQRPATLLSGPTAQP